MHTPQLPARQQNILELIAEGYEDQDIADRLGIGVRTVHTHSAFLREALGANNRAHAVAIGYQTGLLE